MHNNIRSSNSIEIPSMPTAYLGGSFLLLLAVAFQAYSIGTREWLRDKDGRRMMDIGLFEECRWKDDVCTEHRNPTLSLQSVRVTLIISCLIAFAALVVAIVLMVKSTSLGKANVRLLAWVITFLCFLAALLDINSIIVYATAIFHPKLHHLEYSFAVSVMASIMTVIAGIFLGVGSKGLKTKSVSKMHVSKNEHADGTHAQQGKKRAVLESFTDHGKVDFGTTV